jgi:hypothetical protein
VPGRDGPSPTLFTPFVPRPFANPVGTVLVVDARGRVFDDASFGKPAPPFRALPLGAPEARFLHHNNIHVTMTSQKRENINEPLLDHISLQ